MENNINARMVVHNQAQKRYEMIVDGDTAIVEYILEPDDVIVLTHTFVPSKHEGKGIGAALVRGVLEEIKGTGLRVVPQCDFIAKYILRHPEFEELVIRKTSEK